MSPQSRSRGGSKSGSKGGARSAPTDRRRAELRKKRVLERAQAMAVRRQTRRKRVLRAVGIVVASILACGAAVGVWLLVKPGPAKAEKPALRSQFSLAPGVLDLGAAPAAYRILYRVETYPEGEQKGVKPAVTTEEVTVQRPFDGRVLEKAGEPPGDKVQLDIRSTLGAQGDYTSDPKLSRQEPALALGDVRFDAARQLLVDEKLFQPRERRKALGRDCQVYRTGSPVESLSVTAPSDKIYADACIDASGLLLEELTVNGGKLTNRLTAIDVDDHASISPDTLAVGTPAPGGQGGVGLARLDLTARPVPGYWQFPGGTPPPGYSHTARYTSTPAAADPSTPSAAPTYFDVYTSGIDVVIVQQGPKGSAPDPGILPGTDVDGGPLGAAKLVPGLAGNVLTANPTPDTFARVIATLTDEEASAWVQGLRATG